MQLLTIMVKRSAKNPRGISSAVCRANVKHAIIFFIVFKTHKVSGFIQALGWKANSVWIPTTSATSSMQFSPRTIGLYGNNSLPLLILGNPTTHYNIPSNECGHKVAKLQN